MEQLPEGRDADQRVDAPGVERIGQPIRGELVEVGDLRAEHQGDQQATTKLEGVVQRQHAEDALANAQIEQSGDLRGQRGEVAVREYDALGLPGGAAGEEHRGDVVGGRAPAQGRQAGLVGPAQYVRQRERAQTWKRSESLHHLRACQQERRLRRRRAVLHLLRGEALIERSCRRPGLEDPEVAHRPLRAVLRHEQDAIAGLDSRRLQRPAGAVGEPGQLVVGDAVVSRARQLARAVLAGVEAESDAGTEGMARRREQGEQVLGLGHLALERLGFLLETREDPLLEPAHVDFHPVPPPVDGFRVPGELRAIVLRELRPELPGVLALEDEPFPGDERQEEVPGHLQRCELAVDAFQRLVGARQQRSGPGRAPRRSAFGNQLAQSLRRCTEEWRAGCEVELLRCGIRLEEGVDPVLERAALALRHAFVHLPPLVQRHQLDGAPDVEGVHVAGRELEDALLQPPRARRSRDAEDAGRDEVDRNQVEHQLVSRGKDPLSFEPHEHQRRGGREPFVPAREGKAERALHDGGAHQRVLAAARRDGLLAHRLGVRVRVRPAPGPRSLHSRLDELLREPEFPLATGGESERLLIRGIPPFFLEPADGRGAELRGESAVVRLRAQPRHDGVDVLQLGIDDEGDARRLVEIVRLRIAADQRLVLEHRAATCSRDEAGGDVHERRARPLAQLRGVACPLGIHPHRQLQRGIEGDEPRGVDHARQLAGELFDLLLGEAEHRIGDVAGKSDAFLSQEGLEAVAVAFAQRSERLRSGDLAEETVFGRPAGARTHEDVNPAHVRIAVEQHRQRHLAEEAGDAGDEDLVAGEGSLEIEAQGCSFAAIPGFAEGPPPCSGSCRTPSCAARATSVITIGG